MPKLFHSPNSRSSRVIAQLMQMGHLSDVEVVVVDVPRQDGGGRRDPGNPHPEGKVPFLITDDGQEVRESAAIMMYLDEQFGQPLNPKPGSVERGAYLSWMAYYGGVLEPVLVAAFAGIEHPAFASTFRSMEEVGAALERGLGDKPFLLGEDLSTADILMASAFQWAPQFMPDSAVIKTWVKRVGEAMDGAALQAYETAAMEQLSALEPA
ncbi:glutathione S-transferase family protein [Phycobacter sp. K97]|uniref:glutathione S-transferase family protein n=1 Tax=Phycobacter sedimenti TaxID=3133977 RepID=UPI00311D92B1